MIVELLADTADPLVTATHAIFIGKGHKAPAAVVGLQFQHSSLATHFVNITSTVSRMFNFSSTYNYRDVISEFAFFSVPV